MRTRQISLDDERIRDGVYQLEDHGGGLRRWTNGNFVLDPLLWNGLSGEVSLMVTYDVTTLRGWIAPAAVQKSEAVDRPKLRAVG